MKTLQISYHYVGVFYFIVTVILTLDVLERKGVTAGKLSKSRTTT